MLLIQAAFNFIIQSSEMSPRPALIAISRLIERQTATIPLRYHDSWQESFRANFYSYRLFHLKH